MNPNQQKKTVCTWCSALHRRQFIRLPRLTKAFGSSELMLGMVVVSLLHFFVANCFIDNARAFLQWNAFETAGDCPICKSFVLLQSLQQLPVIASVWQNWINDMSNPRLEYFMIDEWMPVNILTACLVRGGKRPSLPLGFQTRNTMQFILGVFSVLLWHAIENLPRQSQYENEKWRCCWLKIYCDEIIEPAIKWESEREERVSSSDLLLLICLSKHHHSACISYWDLISTHFAQAYLDAIKKL